MTSWHIDDLFAQPAFARTPPRTEFPESELPTDVAYQIVHDELMLDGASRVNLATFCTTWLDNSARRLMNECLDKNIVDKDEYPQTADIESAVCT